ncbi:MAG: hypothetical protein HDS43_06090 [Bacteroides sp.]|nr:hypothetical protein [Bacteroides sp.]
MDEEESHRKEGEDGRRLKKNPNKQKGDKNNKKASNLHSIRGIRNLSLVFGCHPLPPAKQGGSVLAIRSIQKIKSILYL